MAEISKTGLNGIEDRIHFHKLYSKATNVTPEYLYLGVPLKVPIAATMLSKEGTSLNIDAETETNEGINASVVELITSEHIKITSFDVMEKGKSVCGKHIMKSHEADAYDLSAYRHIPKPADVDGVESSISSHPPYSHEVEVHVPDSRKEVEQGSVCGELSEPTILNSCHVEFCNSNGSFDDLNIDLHNDTAATPNSNTKENDTMKNTEKYITCQTKQLPDVRKESTNENENTNEKENISKYLDCKIHGRKSPTLLENINKNTIYDHPLRNVLKLQKNHKHVRTTKKINEPTNENKTTLEQKDEFKPFGSKLHDNKSAMVSDYISETTETAWELKDQPLENMLKLRKKQTKLRKQKGISLLQRLNCTSAKSVDGRRRDFTDDMTDDNGDLHRIENGIVKAVYLKKVDNCDRLTK